LLSLHSRREGLYCIPAFSLSFVGNELFLERWSTQCSAWQATGMHCFGHGPAGDSRGALGPRPSVTGHSSPVKVTLSSGSSTLPSLPCQVLQATWSIKPLNDYHGRAGLQNRPGEHISMNAVIIGVM
jgi:hypothetical protein